MTQFLLTVWHEPGAHAAGTAYASEEEMMAAFAAVGQFNQMLQDRGAWVTAGGLTPPEEATVVDGTQPDAGPVTTEGPLAEASHHLGGFWIIEAADQDEAVNLAAAASSACGGPVEVRALQG